MHRRTLHMSAHRASRSRSVNPGSCCLLAADPPLTPLQLQIEVAIRVKPGPVIAHNVRTAWRACAGGVCVDLPEAVFADSREDEKAEENRGHEKQKGQTHKYTKDT